MDSMENHLRMNGVISFLKRAKGCSTQQVESLEKEFKLTLPESYKDFLISFGQKCGSLLEGSDYQYKYLRENQDYVEDILKLKKYESTPFVFIVHQGYIAYFFLCDGSKNPEVYKYLVDEERISRLPVRFVQFIYDSANPRDS